MTNLSLWVLLFPLLGFLILGLVGRFLGRAAILAVGWGACGLSFVFALINFLIMNGTPVEERISDQTVFTWMLSGGLNGGPQLSIDFGLLLDPLSMVMLLVVTGVGFLIHIYSAGYMEEDPSFWRFFAYLNFFIFAMVLLVVANNFLFLLVGWGLVGLASFLLIGFWYQRASAVAAARKAFVINIIGDFSLMVAIFILFASLGVLSFAGVFERVGELPEYIALAVTLLLFVACAAKSAQLPLYMWLPDAMEGPTPVSALIHAATMVTAGVYLVARAYPLFDAAPLTLTTIAVIGAATALFAATIALVQLDIKRVLAYSTISQLGYMFMAEGVQGYNAGIFHLVTHAFFKALLFLGAGAVIYALHHEQDIRKMGGLRHRMPITFWTFVIATLAIAGIFPLSGFWSKDDILAVVLTKAQETGDPLMYTLFGVGVLTAVLTAFYMFRLLFVVFFGQYRGEPASGHHAVHVQEEEEGDSANTVAGHSHVGGMPYYEVYETPTVMWLPLTILAFLSAVGGLLGLPGWAPLSNFLHPVFESGHPLEPTASALWIASGISLVLAIAAGVVAWLRYGKGFQYKENRNPFYRLLLNKYYVDEILNAVLVQPLLAIGRFCSRILEGGLLDGGSRGIAWLLSGTSTVVRKVQTGYARNYALGIVLGVVLIVLYYAVRG